VSDRLQAAGDQDRRGRDGRGESRRAAFARDLLNSDHAGHRLTFQLFAQSPAFAHLLAVYNNYDFEGAADLVRRYAGLERSPVVGAGDGPAPASTAGFAERVTPRR
jgi:4-hydroxyphenylacetate 3-hydroxylase C terminal